MVRTEMIARLDTDMQWDICIIGGGATGLSAALDSAARGYKTILFEQYDFAKGTSSRSTKLVHGGVRYLQQGNIKLVFEALRERGLLKKNAPSIVHNQQFIVPNYKWWEKPFYGIGLKIYDKMAGKLGLGPSVFLSKEQTLERLPGLDPVDLRGGILYHDGQFDDARLAIRIAQTAVAKGAVLLNYFPVRNFLKKNNTVCGVVVIDSITGKEYEIRSKAVINATGVFTDQVLRIDSAAHEDIITPSQGIHLVVDKEFLKGDTAIMIPRTDDGRVLFAVPWHDKLILGTTDTAVHSIQADPVPLEEEINFMLDHIGRYLTKQPVQGDIKSMFAGLRPLVKAKTRKTASLSRDHLITITPSNLITVTGGKWTTCRKMAEDVIDIASHSAQLSLCPCTTMDLSLELNQSFVPPSIERTNENDLRQFVKTAVWEEMCMQPEDFLSRRSRQLLLDAKIAIEKTPAVTKYIAEELGKDEVWIAEQINNFHNIAKNYLPRGNS